MHVFCEDCNALAPMALELAHNVTGLRYFCDECSDLISDREESELRAIELERRDRCEEKS